MAAYAAVVSLHHTINALLLNLSSRVSSSTREILEFAHKEASSLQKVLERLNGSKRSRSSMERVDALEGQIRDCAHTLEDALEFHELKLEEEEEEEADEGAMVQEIRSFGEAAKRLEKEYIEELSREDDDDDEDTTNGSSDDIDFGVEMIGRSRLFNTILKEKVVYGMRPDDRYVFAFLGKEGSCSRVVVKTVFENAREAGKFERWGWARGSELKHILVSLIAQVEADHVDDDYELPNNIDVSEDELSEHLYKALENRSYMIVLEGLDDEELLAYLRVNSFPDQGNRSVVFVIAISISKKCANVWYDYNFVDLYDEEFWYIMRQKLFGGEPILAELDVAGKEIVHNCRSLPIPLAKTLVFLSKSDKRVERWSKLAADKENPIFTVADEISETSEIQKEIEYCETGVAQLALNFLDVSFEVENVNKEMFPERFFSKMQIISFFGMTGIGKTTFARNIFNNDSTLCFFDHHVWIPIGSRYRTEEILIDILAQIYPDIPKLHMNGDEKLVGELCEQVSHKRCLIVLDDLCSQAPLHQLKEIFPTIKGTILVTTRQPKVAKFGRNDTTIEIQLLDEEESWFLLCRKVFDGGLCPPELEKASHKIAEKCDSLPLLILTVADQLRKVEQSEEYWNNVASGKEKSVFKNAHHQISEALLLPSYHNLTQHLKQCFLYIGIFLERYDIPTSHLINFWTSEGFLKPNLSRLEEDFVAECLSDLVDISLVMVQRNVSSSPIKICRLHSVFWHLSNSQAAKSKYFHAMNSYDDCSIVSITSRCRLCIRNNILLSMKDVRKSMASNISVHSFLCVGPLHPYPVPLNFDLRLLRVMNAHTIRLYEFPTEVTSLFHLRYLSLTCNGELPASISKLRKLQCMIVNRYMNIKSSKRNSYLPLEIWDMKELKHLQIMGGCLPNHRHGSGFY